ncbi:MAG: sigma-54 dependent transcriptional regulator [Planctomycetota bacterium]
MNSSRSRTRSGDPNADGFSFSEAVRILLLELFEEFPAERAFFVEWTPMADGDGGSQSLRVVQAFAADGTTIDHPDYHLDQHYLREIGRVDGARLLGGPEDGVGRPLLSCSLPLDNGTRGVVLLEGKTGGRDFSAESVDRLEDHLNTIHTHLRLLYMVSSRDEALQQMTGRVDELARQLEVRELELGGVRSTLEEERFEDEVTHYQEIVTRSASMKELFNVVERVKDTDINVLIAGETGTGKELIARAIHFGGVRAGAPFEIVSCGSIPVNLIESELFGYKKGAFSGADADKKGIFERASGGTVFLDELSDMSTEMQQKILRVLQEGIVRPVGGADSVRVDVRVISSTQRDLTELVQKKTFREDLFYRLNVITLEVPPLRERREDIPLLLEHFMQERIEEEEVTKRFSDSALRELYQYAWPGNIQELKNVVTRAFLSSSKRTISRRVILPLLASQGGGLFYGKEIYQEGEQLHLTVAHQEGFNEIIAECEKLILLTALRRNRGNKSRVTQQLGIPRQTLYNKLEKYGIVDSDYLGDDGE